MQVFVESKLPSKSALLLLDDGTVFRGKSLGYNGVTTGEICFNTGMTGYQEIFTDPSYFGQILVMTNAHIGNYGTFAPDQESNDVKISGLIVRAASTDYSRTCADEGLQNYLKTNKIVGISQLDTRALVQRIRDKGAMNALICTDDSKSIEELKAILKATPSMSGLELASKVSTAESYTLGDPECPYRVAVMDYGVKQTILKNLEKRSCYVKVFPARATYEEVKAWKPTGIFLSNGPGDPATMDYAIDFCRKALTENMPIFGICLGHQLLALANGIPTYKMHHGHRGINHPILNLKTGKCEITSQNHGFSVSADAIKANKDSLEITHINLNDDTIEGIQVKDKKAFSVQYHPEAAPGPHDSRYLFDQFIHTMDDVQHFEIIKSSNEYYS